MDEHVIAVLYARYEDGGGGKRRPAFIIKFDNEQIIFFKITSQFENKSEAVKAKYFEIIDWLEAGLRKESWIDTVKVQYVSETEAKIHVIGRLSDRDYQRFIGFLESRFGN